MRKLITLITLVAFVCFSYSCASTKIIYSDKEYTDKKDYIDWEKLEKDKTKIEKLQKVSGEIITFSSDQYGKAIDGFVEGVSKIGSDDYVKIPYSKIKWVKTHGKMSLSSCLLSSGGIVAGVAIVGGIAFLITLGAGKGY